MKEVVMPVLGMQGLDMPEQYNCAGPECARDGQFCWSQAVVQRVDVPHLGSCKVVQGLGKQGLISCAWTRCASTNQSGKH